MAKARILLEFLCQTGPQQVGEDAAALCHQETLFAESVGDVRQRCRLFLADLGTQVCSPAAVKANEGTRLDLPGSGSVSADG